MRSTCSLYIDAGYLLAAAATRVTGTSLRAGIHVDYDALVTALVAKAEERAPVFRCCASTGTTRPATACRTPNRNASVSWRR
jgi:hypothetical protein